MRQQSGRGGRDASTRSQPLGPRGRLRFRPERGSSLSSCYAGMAASRWTDLLKQDTSVFCQQRFSLKSKAKPAYSGTWLQAPDMLLSRKREAGTARAAKRTGPEPAPPRGHPGATRTQHGEMDAIAAKRVTGCTRPREQRPGKPCQHNAPCAVAPVWPVAAVTNHHRVSG